MFHLDPPHELSWEAALVREPLLLAPATPLDVAIAKLNWQPAAGAASPQSCILVADDTRHLQGIATARDLLLPLAQQVELASLCLADVMTQPAIAYPRTLLADLLCVLSLLQRHQIHHLPVLGERQTIYGLLTTASIQASLKVERLFQQRRAGELNVVLASAPPDAPAIALAAQMLAQQTTCLLVLPDGEAAAPPRAIAARDLLCAHQQGCDLHATPAIALAQALPDPLAATATLWEAYQQFQASQCPVLLVQGDRPGLYDGLVAADLWQVLAPRELYRTLQQQPAPEAPLARQPQDARLPLTPASAASLEWLVSGADWHEQLHFLPKLADALPGILYIYDLSAQRLIYSNRAVADVLGYEIKVFCDLSAGQFQQLIHPDDRDPLAHHGRQLARAADNTILKLEYRLRAADGSWRWLASRDTPFRRTANGQVQQILGTATDITERRQTEQALRSAYANLWELNERLEHSITDLRQRNTDLATLGRMLEFIQASETVADIYGALTEFLRQLFPDCAGAVALRDRDSPELRAVTSFGSLAASEQTLMASDCWALRRSQMHVATCQQPGFFCKHIEQEPLPAATLCVPLLAQGHVQGLFHLRAPTDHYFSETRRYFARTVAEQISLAIANLQLREQLRDESSRDPLTGLYNRRYLATALARELQNAQAQQQPLSAVMIDIDHFKHFNDQFGHDAGDLVLRDLGCLLQGQVRGSDIACRYGGEELTIVLPATPLAVAQARAEAIATAVRALPLEYEGQSLGRLTVSLGVASYPEHGTTAGELWKQADRALYDAKAAGRDRVAIAAPPAPSALPTPARNSEPLSTVEIRRESG